MANFNKVILAGNLTRDPQLSYLPSNTPVAEFGLAINRRWRGQDGQLKDETCFVDCRVYGKQAETFNQYMAKGRSVLVEGRLQLQQWTTTDGAKRSKHMVVVESFQFLGGRDGAPGAPGGERPATRVPAETTAPADYAPDMPPPPSEDEIPF